MAHDTRETIEEFDVVYLRNDLLDRFNEGEFDVATMHQKFSELAEGFRTSSLPGVALGVSVEKPV